MLIPCVADPAIAQSDSGNLENLVRSTAHEAPPMRFNLFARVLIGVALGLPLPLLAQEPSPRANEHRVALVIGNSSYTHSPLKNPVNDARAMRDKLKKMDFDVIIRENMKARDIGGALR